MADKMGSAPFTNQAIPSMNTRLIYKTELIGSWIFFTGQGAKTSTACKRCRTYFSVGKEGAMQTRK
jgi:hypothetical protein